MPRRSAGRTPPIRRLRRRARLRRWVQVLLLCLGVVGLTPLGEALDLLRDAPHPAELVPDCREDCDAGCADAGCHGDRHHCGCCAPSPGLAPLAAAVAPHARVPADHHRPPPLLTPPQRAPPAPWWPPRA